MESARYRSHLSWILILQTIFSIFLSTWNVTPSDASSTTSPTFNASSETPSPTTTASTTTPPPAFPGQLCNGLLNDSCVAHAFCNNNICQCNQTFYNLSNSCVSRLRPGDMCNSTDQCVSSASCLNVTGSIKNCTCFDTHYADINQGVCKPRLRPGDMCNTTDQCVSSASCLTVTGIIKNCTCFDTHYADNNQGVCKPRLRPGDMCNTTDQCVSSASCLTVTGIIKNCTCFDTHYADNNQGVCKPRLRPGDMCNSTDQCVSSASCLNVTGSIKNCTCFDTHYADINQGVCKPRLRPGDMCNTTDQCVSSASCLTVTGIIKNCTCFDTHYADNNQGVCKPRLGPGDMCNTTDQCVSSANCTSGNGGIKNCTCFDTHYADNNQGVCKPRLRPGDMCNSTDQCVSSASCLTVTGIIKNCTCFDTHYADNNQGVCKPRLRPGDLCNSNDQCVSSANCTSGNGGIKNCTCFDTHYADNNQGVCKPSLGYGENCTTGVVNMCSQLLTCRNTTQKCLCKDSSFRYNNTCYAVKNLQVTGITRNNVEETSLNLTWKQPVLGDQFRYYVSLNNGMSNERNVSSMRFESLTAGTLYTASVVTSVERDPGYSGTESSPAVTSSFYTKPAMPGLLSASVYLGPDVNLTFTKSVGGVDFYIVNVTQQESGRLWTKNISSASDPVHVVLPNQTAGAYYNVTIVAYIGGISSDTRTASYRVEVDIAGEVTELTVTQPGSRWANVRWRRPKNPNGEILGYTVEVTPLNNSTCVSGVAVLCSNCNETQMPDISNCTVNDTKKQTREELKSDVTWQEVNVTSLSPYVSYQVTVTAVNEKGRGQESKIQFKTQSEAADNLVSLTVKEPLTVGELNITWVPGERRGNTSYNVTWFEETSIGSEQFSYKGGLILFDYTLNAYTITGLLSYWKYLVSVRPSTEIGLSPDENYTVARTLDSAPGEVEIFAINQPSDSATYLQFTVSCPKEKARNGNITFFVFRSSVPVNETLGSVSVTSGCNENYTFNASVKAETNYTFEAFANTIKHEGTFKTSKFYVEPKAPTLGVNPDYGGSLLKDASDVTQTTAVISICPCVVTDRSQGNITLAGLIVCKGKCETSSDPNYFRSRIMTWTQFKENGYKGSYRPTPDDWHATQDVGLSRKKRSAFLSRSIRETLKKIEFTLGKDVNCEQKNKTVYCNGPLPSDSEFVVKVFACTAGGCKEADTGITIITLREDNKTGAIVGGVLGAFAGVCLIVLIIFFVMRRRRRSMAKTHKYVSSVKKTPTRRPIKLQDFKAHLDLLHSDSNLRFQEEFEDIQEKSPKNYTQEAATTDANKVKNRYVNILPYDHTRVKLTTADDDETSDFINANYIPGFSSPREYIATQGPMTGTVDDFWRMIWEQKSGVIVMLSDLQEKGRPKVDLYWPTEPNSPVLYGDIVVELKSTSTLNKYTIRDFIVSMESQEKRKVLQFFIPGWEDYSANLDSDDVLEFIQAVRQQARTSRGPVTVHCSAGVGRTGTFIALDFLMQYVGDNDLGADVDIYNLVLNMRHNRPHMVQSEKQYIFIHDTLKVIIDKKIKCMQDDNNIYMNTGSGDDNIYANTNPAFEPEENLYMNTDTWKPTTSL